MNRGHPPRAANVHEIVYIDDVDNFGIDDGDSADNIPHESDIVAMASKQKSNTTPNRKMATPPDDIHRLMSSNTKCDNDGNSPKEITIDGKVYCLRINIHITYHAFLDRKTYFKLIMLKFLLESMEYLGSEQYVFSSHLPKSFV
jgi:hypothetical protein